MNEFQRSLVRGTGDELRLKWGDLRLKQIIRDFEESGDEEKINTAEILREMTGL